MFKQKKKLIVVFLTVFMLMSSINIYSLADVKTGPDINFRDIEVFIDGKKVGFQIGSETMEPLIYKDRVYVPIKTIAELLGKAVVWDGKKNNVVIEAKAEEVVETSEEEVVEKPEETIEFYELEELNWEPKTREALNNFMKKYGKSSPDYDPNQRPYVVFDFDNTTAFFDVQEQMLIYQLENLEFKIHPDQMYDVLCTEVPKDNFLQEYNSLDGKSLNIDIVARDISKAYKWLYENYEGFGAGGTMTLEEVRETPEYQEFITKVRYLYDAIGDTFDAAVSYPWVTYLFTGMTKEEVLDLATRSHDYWFAYDVWSKRTWTSPEDYPSEAGVVTATYLTSTRLPEESVGLYQKLAANGFDIYVVSASFIDAIEALAYNPKYGLNVEPGRVYAMMLKTDSEGRYINEYDYDNYYQTQGPGKVKTIDKFIAPKYNGRGPIFVAGDSQGDYNMMTEYEDTVLNLIVNRVRKDDFKYISKEAVEQYGDPNAKYVMQGRNENTGRYIPSIGSIRLGKTEIQILTEEMLD
ncbi:MAG: haloacid dehalogenase-like hydrolase [Clostridiales bacterium]|nr:haloacid dehalogenase-like hydrolase [Clostridiales bacterium]